jgi:processive 1,2-diacylglycerol beta-glucosyltransferase
VAGCKFVVMAGRNAALLQRLRSSADGMQSRLRVYGWTEHMAQFIAAADFVIGKPGGLTVAEVLACGRPMLVTRSLRGQESFNVRFLEQEGVGKFIPAHELTAWVRRWLAAPHELRDLQERAWRTGRRDGAARVAKHALALARASMSSGDVIKAGEVNGHR